MPIDPGIELLPDVPIAGPADDLLGHAPLAERLVELACASPAATPRVIGLVGTAGVGKTSVLHLAGLLLAERPEVATVAIDAGDHGTADATLAAMTATIHEVFKSGGVVEAADAARATPWPATARWCRPRCAWPASRSTSRGRSSAQRPRPGPSWSRTPSSSASAW
jgi:hypothetical protein